MYIGKVAIFGAALVFIASFVCTSCGGTSSDVVLQKHITCVFLNQSAQAVFFKYPSVPSFNQNVPSGGSSTNPGFNLEIFSTSPFTTWTFNVNDTVGNQLATGSYQWTQTDAENHTKLQVTYGADGKVSFVSQ